MIVCVCRAVSDRQIRSSLRDGVGTMQQLRSELGVASCCGKCGPRVRELIDEHRAGQASQESALLGCACAAA
ncbi:MAG TPA: (2Fe-2S)-binding protein [Zeimonas sp.]|nr:(2Fe-2S)-binding protein [Zeimonas sp.]